MNYNNSLFIFETLLRDNIFMSTIDNYIGKKIELNSKVNKTFESKNAPELVLLLSSLLLHSNNYINVEKNIRDDNDIRELFELFYDYIVNKIEELIKGAYSHKEEFKLLYDICCRLVILKFKYAKKTGMFCIKNSK